MRKCLLLVALLISVSWNGLKAQGLFDFETDTVCVRQTVNLISHAAGASSYYWGFCSGYLLNNPSVTNKGAGFSFSTPSAIEVAKDGSNYYAFVANAGSGNLLRLDYGTSLSNTPAVYNYGTLGSAMPPQPSSMHIMQVGGNWFLFVTGGATATTSTLARVDFGSQLNNNSPNIVNMANPGNLLNGPRGVFVAAEGSNFYGYLVNSNDDKLIRLDFGTSVSLTPTATDLGNIGTLSGPSDIAAAQENGNWYFFITNRTSSTVTRLEFGNSLNNTPLAASGNLGSFGGTLFGPSAITLVADCGGTYALITNGLSDEIVRVSMSSLADAPANITARNLGGFASSFSGPSDITNVIRDHDNLYAYVVNATGNNLTEVNFSQCTNSSIASSTLATPPPYEYAQPGLYNVYVAVNEGQPTASITCKQIRVLPIPAITISVDTILCQGDSIKLFAQTNNALSFNWSPNYNISDTVGNAVFVHPEYSLHYNLRIPYTYGCIVDTFVAIKVSKIKADAGPDHVIGDGASVTLGGPYTTVGPQYTYRWTPDQFLTSNSTIAPSANPAYTITYYLEVRDTTGCRSIDTAIVRVDCSDLHLPNAFAPEGINNRFGIMNKQIVQLNYFRIFDRWGQEVFKTTDVTKTWDGNVNGKPAPVGVYVWEADGFCTSGLRFSRSGNVTLFR